MADPKLLLVEDDESIGRGLETALRAEGYEVEWVTTGRDALRAVALDVFALALLDLGLPDIDGLEVCQRLRSTVPALPVIVLTARADEIDIVVGLDAGASDYVTKPFTLAVLLARVRAHLRRTEDLADLEVLEVGDVRLDIAAHRTFVDTVEVDLRPKEFHLLLVLMREVGRVVTRERLLDEVWEVSWETSTKTLDMHAHLLRRKLGEGERRPRVVTVRGIGYRLEEP